MPNIFNVIDYLTMESLRRLINKSQVAQFFNTDYNKSYTQEFPVGETVRVKLPQRFLVRNGISYNPQPITRKYTTVTVDQIFGVDFEWDSVEAALRAERGMDQIKAEYINPAMDQLASELDSRCTRWATLNTNNVVGTLGTTPTTNSVYLAAKQRLFENSCPEGPKGMIVSAAMENAIANTNIVNFHPAPEVTAMFKEGSMGRAFAFDWYCSNQLYSLTAGAWGGAVTVHGSNQSGNTLWVNATAGDTFMPGDVISIAGVNNANPVTRRSTGVLKQFVVVNALTAAGGGAAGDVLTIRAAGGAGDVAIVGPGDQYQNVDSLPQNLAALTLYPGTTTPNGKTGIQGLALHRDAFALVGVKLESPKATELTSQTRDPATGIAVRFVRMFDPQQSKMINRFDILIGMGNLYPDNCAVRVASGA